MQCRTSEMVPVFTVYIMCPEIQCWGGHTSCYEHFRALTTHSSEPAPHAMRSPPEPTSSAKMTADWNTLLPPLSFLSPPPPPLHQCYLLSSILMCLLPWRWLFAGYSSSICSVPSPYLPRLNLHTKLSLYQLTFPQGSIYLNRNLGIQIALDRWFIFSLMDDNTSCSGNGSKRVVVKVSKRCSFLQFN